MPSELEELPVLSNNERLVISMIWGVSGYLLGGKGQIGAALGLAGAAWYWNKIRQAKLVPVIVQTPAPVKQLQGYYYE